MADTIRAHGSVEVPAAAAEVFQPGPDGTTIAEFACVCEVPPVLPGMAGWAVVGIARQALRHGLVEGLSRLCHAFETRATGNLAISGAERALPA